MPNSLVRLQSRLQHIYHGQPYARIDINPVPESILFLSQGLGFSFGCAQTVCLRHSIQSQDRVSE
jgi:hypothetical protein